jgi:hypothetical protein
VAPFKAGNLRSRKAYGIILSLRLKAKNLGGEKGEKGRWEGSLV